MTKKTKFITAIASVIGACAILATPTAIIATSTIRIIDSSPNKITAPITPIEELTKINNYEIKYDSKLNQLLCKDVNGTKWLPAISDSGGFVYPDENKNHIIAYKPKLLAKNRSSLINGYSSSQQHIYIYIYTFNCSSNIWGIY